VKRSEIEVLRKKEKGQEGKYFGIKHECLLLWDEGVCLHIYQKKARPSYDLEPSYGGSRQYDNKLDRMTSK
jgi:hypothetical protein